MGSLPHRSPGRRIGFISRIMGAGRPAFPSPRWPSRPAASMELVGQLDAFARSAWARLMRAADGRRRIAGLFRIITVARKDAPRDREQEEIRQNPQNRFHSLIPIGGRPKTGAVVPEVCPPFRRHAMGCSPLSNPVWAARLRSPPPARRACQTGSDRPWKGKRGGVNT